MPYTLAMFLLWGVLMALIGGVVGWMLCRVRTRARSRRSPDATDRNRTHDTARDPTR